MHICLSRLDLVSVSRKNAPLCPGGGKLSQPRPAPCRWRGWHVSLPGGGVAFGIAEAGEKMSSVALRSPVIMSKEENFLADLRQIHGTAGKRMSVV